MNIDDLKIKSAGKFIKIESGEPQDLRVLTENIVERMIHGFGKEAVTCGGPGCFKCAGGVDIKQRFFVNVYNHNVQRVMLWEFGPGIAKSLKSIAKTLKEENRTILDVDIKVEADGSGMNKKYKVIPRMTAKEIPAGLILHKIEVDEGIPF